MDYWQRVEVPPDKTWLLPETRRGTITLMGGNTRSLSGLSKTAMSIRPQKIARLSVLVPDTAKSLLAHIGSDQDISFLPSTASGELAPNTDFSLPLSISGVNVLFGDFGKNLALATALVQAVRDSETPTILARDALGTFIEEAELLLSQPTPNVLFFAPLPALQDFLKSTFYPVVMTLSLPLNRYVEIFHKFTISYPSVRILTFAAGHILVAVNGEVRTASLPVRYTPMTIWGPEPLANLSTFTAWNGLEIDPILASFF